MNDKTDFQQEKTKGKEADQGTVIFTWSLLNFYEIFLCRFSEIIF